MVEELRRQKRVKHYAKGSQIVDLILEKIAGYYVNDSYHNVHDVRSTTELPVYLGTRTLKNMPVKIISKYATR